MRIARYFEDQLRSGLDGFTWAVRQVPAERHALRPPATLGEWTAARHAFHMLYYEREIALPSMRLWLGGPPLVLGTLDEDEAWGAGHDVEHVLPELAHIRAEQITLVSAYDDAAWETARETIWTKPEPWGAIRLRWVVTKTLQHTAEHTHDVLRMALFWDGAAAREQARHGQ